MTGGGFGGSILALAERERADEVGAAVADAYRRTYAYEPCVFVCSAAGAGELVRHQDGGRASCGRALVGRRRHGRACKALPGRLSPRSSRHRREPGHAVPRVQSRAVHLVGRAVRVRVGHGSPSRVATMRLSRSATDTTISPALAAAGNAHFPPLWTTPDARLFASPQYALWIELVFEPTQAKGDRICRRGAGARLPAGSHPRRAVARRVRRLGVRLPGRFPDPNGMVDDLHRLGFAVSVWLVPYVTPDSVVFRHLHEHHLLLRDEAGEPLDRQMVERVQRGSRSAQPGRDRWLERRLRRSVISASTGSSSTAGTGRSMPSSTVHTPRITRPRGTRSGFSTRSTNTAPPGGQLGLPACAAAARQASLLESRKWACKPHSARNVWPQSLTGHAFHCPDMIGGGDYLVLPAAQLRRFARRGAVRPFGSVLGALPDDAVLRRSVACARRRGKARVLPRRGAAPM